jgi:hypothetical protein
VIGVGGSLFIVQGHIWSIESLLVNSHTKSKKKLEKPKHGNLGDSLANLVRVLGL